MSIKNLFCYLILLFSLLALITGCGGGTVSTPVITPTVTPYPTYTPTPGGPTATPTITPTPGGPTVTPTTTGTPGNRNKLFFLHHSVGDGLVTTGNMRAIVISYNNINGTNYEFWDHGYNSDGLRNPTGQFTGTNFAIPNDNTDPDGLHYLFTSSNADAVSARNQIMQYDVIAFKSCYTASNIGEDTTLTQYKNWYLDIRNFFDQHPEKIFVVMSPPPLHRLDTNAVAAANARNFANWLKSSDYIGGRANVVCFDLFNYLAGSDNMLNYAYERSHDDPESHPNTLGYQTIGPVFAQFLIDTAKK